MGKKKNSKSGFERKEVYRFRGHQIEGLLREKYGLVEEGSYSLDGYPVVTDPQTGVRVSTAEQDKAFLRKDGEDTGMQESIALDAAVASLLEMFPATSLTRLQSAATRAVGDVGAAAALLLDESNDDAIEVCEQPLARPSRQKVEDESTSSIAANIPEDTLVCIFSFLPVRTQRFYGNCHSERLEGTVSDTMSFGLRIVALSHSADVSKRDESRSWKVC